MHLVGAGTTASGQDHPQGRIVRAELVGIEVKEARERDNRALEPLIISGPFARVTLRLEGQERTFIIPPLEILELRARFPDQRLLKGGARTTALVATLSDLRREGIPTKEHTISPYAVQVPPDSLDVWRELLDQADPLLKGQSVDVQVLGGA